MNVRALIFPLSFVALAACGLRLDHAPLGVEGKGIATDTGDANESIGLSAVLAAVPSLAIDGTQVTLADQVAAQSKITQFFQPAGCVTISEAGNVVTYTFAGCTGPWGQVQIDGTEVATFSPGDTPGSIAVETSGEGLTANSVPIDHHASAVVTFGPTGKVVSWQGSFSGTTAGGRKVEHTSDLELVTDKMTGCLTVNGSTETKIGLRQLDLDIRDVSRCGPVGTCPDGTVVAVGKLTHTTVTLTFDGTPDVVAKGKLGGELDFNPVHATRGRMMALADDESLAEKAKAGDAQAREELARRHLGILQRVVRRYVPEGDAEDVAQKAMMRGLDKIESFRGESSFRSWLHRVAINVALNHVRDTKRDRASEIDEADLITNTLGTQRLVAREAKERLVRLVEELPEKQKLSVKLRLFSEMSFAEIGTELGISEDSAKVSFHHALKRLRVGLDPTFDPHKLKEKG